MPKSFSDAEKTYIRQRLIEEAEDCLSVYGIRKTTVDELVRRVKIPKGTFYLFYESKEALIFDVILKINTEIQEKLVQEVSGMKQKPDAEALTRLIFSLYQSLNGSFLLKLIENGELEILMRKAPPEYIQTNITADDFMVNKLMSLLPKTGEDMHILYSGALRGIFLMLLYKDQIACDRFDEMLLLVIRGVVLQMFGG